MEGLDGPGNGQRFEAEVAPVLDKGSREGSPCWAGGVVGSLLAPVVASSRTGQWGLGGRSPVGHGLIRYPCHSRKRKNPSCLRLPLPCSAALMTSPRFGQWEPRHLLPSGRQPISNGKLSLGKMLSILVLFHISADKDFKHFRHYSLRHQYRACFGALPSYSRFVSLQPRLLPPFYLLLHACRGEKTGIYCADSTTLALCHNARISRNRVFPGLAQRGGTTIAAGSECAAASPADQDGGPLFCLDLP